MIRTCIRLCFCLILPFTENFLEHLLLGDKSWLMNLSTEEKQTHGLGEQTCGGQEGGGGSGMGWEFEVSRCRTLHLEWISNEGLLGSTGNYI